MNTAVYTSINQYWDMLKDLSVESKLALISRLNHSVILSIHTHRKKSSLGACFGAWATDETAYSSAQLLKDIDAVCAEKKDFMDEYIDYGN